MATHQLFTWIVGPFQLDLIDPIIVVNTVINLKRSSIFLVTERRNNALLCTERAILMLRH